MCCHSNVNNDWARLPSSFSKGPMKPDFSDIDLTTFFGVRNFRNKSAIRIILFLKMFKI